MSMTTNDEIKAVSKATADRFYDALASPKMHEAVAALIFEMWTDHGDGPVRLADWPARILTMIRLELGEQ